MKDIDITFHNAIRADRAAGMSYPNISKAYGGLSYKAIKKILEEPVIDVEAVAACNKAIDDLCNAIVPIIADGYNTWVKDYKNPMGGGPV